MDPISQQNLEALLKYIDKPAPQSERTVIYHINKNFAVRVMYYGKDRWLLFSVVYAEATEKMKASIPHFSFCINREEYHQFIFDGEDSRCDTGHSGIKNVAFVVEKFSYFFPK